MTSIKKLSTFTLTLLITGAIDSIRNLPASALFGNTLIFFFILAAILFLIPVALVSAELTANIDEGGIYQWARLAFGEHIGFLGVWLQFITNIVWFPTLLSFIAGTASYLIDPQLATNKIYLLSMILGIFWLLTFINLKGIHFSAKFTSICTIIGVLLPMAFIIFLLCMWVISGKPLQIHPSLQNIFPDWRHMDNWSALTAIILGLAGMELAAVHIKDVKNPQSTFPKAVALSTIIIISTMTLGSLAIAFVLPVEKISLVNGTMQSFAYFLSHYQLAWLTPLLSFLLVIGSMGGMVSWIISPIKGLHQSGQYGFLPDYLQKQNAHGVPKNLLIAQAILVSLICSVFFLFSSLNTAYWLLTAVSVQLYMLVYILIFFSALRLRHQSTYSTNVFSIPGKKIGLWITCLLGLSGCLLTILVGFVPPHNLNIENKFYYELAFFSSVLLMLSPVLFFYSHYYQKNVLALAPEVEGN